jgi:hypothetical protein
MLYLTKRVKIEIINYNSCKIGKYKISHIKIFGIKVEWCFFRNKKMIRLEYNNWDK